MGDLIIGAFGRITRGEPEKTGAAHCLYNVIAALERNADALADVEYAMRQNEVGFVDFLGMHLNVRGLL